MFTETDWRVRERSIWSLRINFFLFWIVYQVARRQWGDYIYNSAPITSELNMTCMCSLSVRGPYPIQRHRVIALLAVQEWASATSCSKRDFSQSSWNNMIQNQALLLHSIHLLNVKVRKTRGLIITISNILNASRILLLNLVCL